jgi:hypothetical protein
MSDEYFEHARREMFPKMKSSALAVIIAGDPDPKLCMELGAAILFNKPIIVTVPRGREIPLSLRTIANKIVEIDVEDREGTARKLNAAVDELLKSLPFRAGGGA